MSPVASIPFGYYAFVMILFFMCVIHPSALYISDRPTSRSPPPNPKQAIFQEEKVGHYSQCLHRKLVNAAHSGGLV